MNQDDAVGYLALDHGLPCGLIRGCLDGANPRRADIFSLWVATAHRRKSIGSDLLDAIRVWAIDRGVQELRLFATNNNQDANAFYQRYGFSITGNKKPYPNDPSLFEYEMVKPLG